MHNSMSSNAVADYFLALTDSNAGDTISNLKLQKLVYYGQAWHLAMRDEPIFAEAIQAWPHGPVVPLLYHRFKGYGWSSIDTTALITDPFEDLPACARDVLDQVYSAYGDFTGKQLEAMTHAEAPWIDARGRAEPLERSDAIITHDAMRRFYRARMAA